jgi:uncharacterized protein YllA (UPF0747 family)
MIEYQIYSHIVETLSVVQSQYITHIMFDNLVAKILLQYGLLLMSHTDPHINLLHAEKII